MLNLQSETVNAVALVLIDDYVIPVVSTGATRSVDGQGFATYTEMLYYAKSGSCYC